MKRTTSISAWTICATGIAVLLLSSFALAAQNARSKGAPPYNPYPLGILPDDLNSELERVVREVDLVEGRVLARWHALGAPVLRGQPPTLQNTGTELIETLGELMNFDRNMSPNRNLACMSCHMPYAGFSGPIPSVNLTIIA
jgi:cytochrome c peroxidase